MDVHERVAGLHPVALVDIDFHHPSGKFAGDAYGCGVGLPLDDFIRLVEETEAYDGKYDADCHHYGHSHHEYLVLALLGSR